MNGERMSELTPRRWAYLKQLRPSPGKFLHVSTGGLFAKGTYDVGRNKAKRAKRAAAKERQLAVGKVSAMLAQYQDRIRAYDKLNQHSKCWCERNDIGVSGVSCGDCPRDYEKALQRSPCN